MRSITIFKERILNESDKTVLKNIIDNPNISKTELVTKLN